MSLWTRTNKPKWVPNAVVGRDGWVHPVTSETLAVFDTKGGATFTLKTVSGPFTVAETVTGGTSSATGVVASYVASTKTLVVNYVSGGPFQVAETLTGGTSGSTAVVVTTVVGPGVVQTPTINSITFYKGFVAASGQAIASKTTAHSTYSYLKFSVQFNSQIKVTGQPYLPITINSVARKALYTPKAGFDIGENTSSTTGGTATLLFVYRCVPSDVCAANGVVISGNINLNGGTIKSYLNSNVATLTNPTNTTATLTTGSTTNGQVLYTALASGASYPALNYPGVEGNAITVAYVNTGGTNGLSCSVSGTAITVTLATSSGTITAGSTATLVKNIVNATPAAAALVTASLPGTGATNVAVQVVTNLSGGITVVPDLQLLTVTSGVSGSILTTPTLNAATYDLGSTVTITTIYDRPITVNTSGGTPFLELVINGVDASVSYASGTGTATLLWTYVVTSAVSGVAGQVALVPEVQLNGGTLVDANSIPINAFFTSPNTSSVIIDGVVPTITGMTGPANGTHLVTTNVVTLTATFSKAVTVTGSPEIQLNITSGNKQAVYATGSGTNTLTFTYPVVVGDSCTAGNFSVHSPLNLNSGTMLDEAGNETSPLTFTPPTVTTVYVN
jgi:hypothetical protein